MVNFLEYHPYLTYSAKEVGFITREGKPISSSWTSAKSGDLRSLWELGKKAFSVLPSFSSVAEFDEAYAIHRTFIERSLEELKGQGAVAKEDYSIFRAEIQRGTPIDNEILGMLSTGDDDESRLREAKDHFLFACLRYIDYALARVLAFNIALDMATGRLEYTDARLMGLVGIGGDLGAARATINATDAFTNYEIVTGEIKFRESNAGRVKGGKNRWSNDEIVKLKKDIFRDFHASDRSKLQKKEDFYREVTTHIEDALCSHLDEEENPIIMARNTTIDWTKKLDNGEEI